MKTTPAIPDSYATWRHCITVECGIELDAQFIAARLHALHDPKDYQTERFIELYGSTHLQAVIGWFEQAAIDLKRS